MFSLGDPPDGLPRRDRHQRWPARGGRIL